MAINTQEKCHALFMAAAPCGALAVADGSGLDSLLQRAVMLRIMAIGTLPEPVAPNSGTGTLTQRFSFWS